MRWMTKIRLRLRSLIRRDSVDAELDEELQFHLDRSIEEHGTTGMTNRDARAAALRELGGLDQHREACRDERGVRGLQDWAQDIRYALRLLLRHPGFATIHVILIAVSIGLVCSAVTVVDAVLLRSLPAVSDPDRLVLISGVGANDNRLGEPLDVFEQLAALREGTTHIFAYRNYGGLPGTVGTTTTPLRGIGVLGNYFEGLGGVPLVMGRAFDPEKDEPVAIIGSWVWREQFGGTPDVLGKTLTLGSVAFSVVGVASADFLGTQPDLRWDLITPFMTLSRARGLSPTAARAQVVYPVARLRSGVTAAQYQTRIQAAWPSILKATVPAGATLDEWRARRGSQVVAESLRKGQAFTLITTPGLPRALALTVGLSGLIFLASCVTLALLVVARAVRNQHHTAIRLALGGTLWRVVRPQALEAGMISLLGCGAGLLIAAWASDLSRSFLPGDWPIALTRSSVAIAVCMALGTTVISAGFAAYLSSRGSVTSVLQSANRASKPHTTLRATLLVSQFAVSVLLVHSTLFYIEDVTALARTELGLDPKNLHVYTLIGRLPQRGLGNDYFRQLIAELKTIPGAESVGASGSSPPLGFIRDLTEPLQGADGTEVHAVTSCVFPGVFEAWNTPRVAGRDLEWTDGPSAVVTDNLARKLYPDGSPLGRPIRSKTPGSHELELVGVVGNMAYNGPRLGLRDVAFVSCLERTNPWPSSFGVQIFIRSRRNLTDLGQDVRRVVDRSAVHYIYQMEDQAAYVAWSMEREHMLATLSSAFGGLILVLTGLGLFAFCSYMQAFRNRELAIRAALGAGPHNIAATLLRETLIVLVVGVGSGLVMTLVLTRLLAGGLVDLGSITVRSSLQATLVLIAVAAVASLLPTLRAVRIDLARAIRVD